MKSLLIDGYAMMFRSFYAVRFSPMYKNTNINAVYGCATTIMQAIEQFNPDYLTVAFDAPEKTFRHEKDQNYKAQREKAPDEFIAQIPYVFELVEAFGIPLLIKPGFEADDIIGTLATQAAQKSIKTFIMSGDLDFLQLVSDDIKLARFNGKLPEIFDRDKTIEKIGLPPEKIIDYKAICGDSSDNYKGIPGIGPKGAVDLLTKFESINGIYKNIDSLPDKQKQKFIDFKDDVFHCQDLATIHLNVPIDYKIPNEKTYQYDGSSVSKHLSSLSLNTLSKRALSLNNNSDQKKAFEQKNNSKNEVKNTPSDQLSFF